MNYEEQCAWWKDYLSVCKDMEEITNAHTRWNCAKLRCGSSFKLTKLKPKLIPVLVEFARREVRNCVAKLDGQSRDMSVEECLGWAVSIRDRELADYVLANYSCDSVTGKPDFDKIFHKIRTTFLYHFGVTVEQAWNEINDRQLQSEREYFEEQHDISAQEYVDSLNMEGDPNGA